MTITLTKRRVLLGLAAFAFASVVTLLLARVALTGMAVNALLRMGGASEIRFNVAGASPWRVVLEDIGFQIRTQVFEARRITVARNHWWMPSLGRVSVEQARVPVTIDGSDVNPMAWARYDNGGKPSAEPWQAPLDELSVDGRLIVQAAGVPPQELAVKIAARLTPEKTWEAHVQADGPGLALQGDATYDVGKDDLGFQVPALSLDVKTWEQFVRRLVVIPGGTWETAGKFTGTAQGRLLGRQLTTTGSVQLKEGRARNDALGINAEGIELALDFTDIARVVTKPGTLRIRELQAGKLRLEAMDYLFALDGPGKIAIVRATFQALGGTVSTEPFNYFPNLREVDAVVLVDGLSIGQIMALTQDLPAKATGRVNGRFPLRIDDGGLRLGTGWLQLMPGVPAEIQFNTSGLLTAGMSQGSPSYTVLRKIESGLLKLKVNEMRLDIRPPDAPPGRSAQLHLSGQPVDPEVKAPVVLDLNVNGPLEKLINLGLDSRLSFGSKP